MREKKGSKIMLVLLFLVMVFMLVLADLFLSPIVKTQIAGMVLYEPIIKEEGGSSLFEVDQILIKTLIKYDEGMIRGINIMDISEEELVIEIEPQHLLDIVSVLDNKFTLKPGQTKTVYVNFSASINEKSVKHEPGVYVGSLLIRDNHNTTKKIPIIVEIETKEVLFDGNIDVPIGQKYIEQGDHLEVQIKLFNLKKIGLTNLDMDYFIKDIAGNTIITESESISIETQTSFVKIIHVPENLNAGEYVFGAVVKYGSSVGTSTILFEIASPVEEIELLSYYKNNKLLFWILGIILAIIISVIGSYIAFTIGLFDRPKIISLFKEKVQRTRKAIEKKEEKKLKKEEGKAENQRQILINRLNRWRTIGYKTTRLEKLMKKFGLVKKEEILEGEDLIIKKLIYKLDLWKKQGFEVEKLGNMLNDYLKWKKIN